MLKKYKIIFEKKKKKKSNIKQLNKNIKKYLNLKIKYTEF